MLFFEKYANRPAPEEIIEFIKMEFLVGDLNTVHFRPTQSKPTPKANQADVVVRAFCVRLTEL